MTHHKYPSIEHLRHVYKSIREYAELKQLKYPAIVFTGTVKLHGVNTAVVQTPSGERYCQSRNRTLTTKDDHMGFAKYVEEHKEVFDAMFDTVWTPKETVVIFGEFAGKGIQKNIGISKLEKQFYPFECKCWTNEEDSITLLHPAMAMPGSVSLFSMYNKTVTLDFSKSLEELTHKLAGHTADVETRCPIAAYALPEDSDLIGEGVVWKAKFSNTVLRIKVKGDKHSEAASRPREPQTAEQLLALTELERVATKLYSPERCQQAIFEIYGPNWDKDISYKELGTYLKWVLQDTWKEEYDILEEEKITSKQVSKPLTQLVRAYFIGALNDTTTTSRG